MFVEVEQFTGSDGLTARFKRETYQKVSPKVETFFGLKRIGFYQVVCFSVVILQTKMCDQIFAAKVTQRVF
jgi:hypothetical protein